MSKMKLLLNDLNLSCQKLVEELKTLSLSKAEDSNEKFHDLLETTNIKFAVATDIVDFSSCIGFISQNNLLPSDLTLELASNLLKVKTGGTILLSICSNKPVSQQAFLKVSTSILHEMSSEEVYRQKKIESSQEMKMRFRSIQRGIYTISAKLYGVHITNSPLMIPVDDVPEELLAKVGLSLVPTSVNVGNLSEVTVNSNDEVTEEPSDNDVEAVKNKWNVGERCLFKRFAELIECQIETVFRNCYDPINYLVKIKDQEIRIIVSEKDLVEIVKVKTNPEHILNLINNNNTITKHGFECAFDGKPCTSEAAISQGNKTRNKV